LLDFGSRRSDKSSAVGGKCC